MIEVIKTEFSDLVIIKPKVFGDVRGYFFESFSERDFKNAGLNFNFVQDNESLSSYGTIRGLHYQRGSYAQTKILRVTRGKILDVVVDLRPASSTFMRSYSIELSDENHLQILVPRGFAHGFAVLSESASIIYKCDNYYSPAHEGGVYAADADLHVDWPIPTGRRIFSEKDRALPSLKTVIENRDWELK